MTFCSTACTNTTTDGANCGTCGHACSSGEVCAGGTCGLVCTPPSTACGTTCANTGIDPQNCGKCGNACGPYQNAAPGCDQGNCVYACNGGYLDCTSATGCETNGQVDLNNCGACGNVCALTFEAASVACSGAACQVATCDSGNADCNGTYSDGCETNILFDDPNNCGGCGVQCDGEGVQGCDNGNCCVECDFGILPFAPEEGCCGS
jgi:hypothetical protein